MSYPPCYNKSKNSKNGPKTMKTKFHQTRLRHHFFTPESPVHSCSLCLASPTAMGSHPSLSVPPAPPNRLTLSNALFLTSHESPEQFATPRIQQSNQSNMSETTLASNPVKVSQTSSSAVKASPAQSNQKKRGGPDFGPWTLDFGPWTLD